MHRRDYGTGIGDHGRATHVVQSTEEQLREYVDEGIVPNDQRTAAISSSASVTTDAKGKALC